MFLPTKFYIWPMTYKCHKILFIYFSLLMCGLPSLATHLLHGDRVKSHWGRWFFDTILQVNLHTLPYVYPIGLAAQTASVYLTVVVTIER